MTAPTIYRFLEGTGGALCWEAQHMPGLHTHAGRFADWSETYAPVPKGLKRTSRDVRWHGVTVERYGERYFLLSYGLSETAFVKVSERAAAAFEIVHQAALAYRAAHT